MHHKTAFSNGLRFSFPLRYELWVISGQRRNLSSYELAGPAKWITRHDPVTKGAVKSTV